MVGVLAITVESLIMEFLPFILMFLGVVVVLAYDALKKKSSELDNIWYSAITTVTVILAAIGVWLSSRYFDISNGEIPSFLDVDDFSMLTSIFLLVGALFVTVVSVQRKEKQTDLGVFYALILLATAGAMLITMSEDFLTVIVGLELLSIPSYALVAFRNSRKYSVEAAMKYFLLGAFSTACILFGTSFYYGATGSLKFSAVSKTEFFDLGNLAAIFLIVGIGFKVSSVPFHAWTPEVYYGAQTSVTTFLSTVSMSAGFIMALKIFFIAMDEFREFFVPIFFVLAVISMTLGNIAALVQKSFKRLLAYSSIGQAGYILSAFAINSDVSIVDEAALIGIIYHVIAHLLSKGGAFFAIAIIIPFLKTDQIDALKGLARKDKLLGLSLLTALLSLAGIPPLVGFFGKLYIILAIVERGGIFIVLAILLVINSAISLYYYSRVIYIMFLEEERTEVKLIKNTVTRVFLVIASLSLLLLFIPLQSLTENAATAIL